MNKFTRRLLFWGGAVVIALLCKKQPYWKFVVLFLSWAAVLDFANRIFGLRRKGRKQEKADTTNPDPRFDTPRKALRGLLYYNISNGLCIFNPFILFQGILQIVGRYWEKTLGHPVLQAEQYKQTVNYILPVSGEWLVFNGGITPETSHSWSIPTQRFAYDLIKHGENGLSFVGNGRKLADYVCFDAPILAPADGIVVSARDGVHDAPFVGTFWMDCFTRNIAGNSVLIKHADGEYCFLAHLKRGSVCVKAGDEVKQGQEIGRCGHSGNSSEPHLHFQFQDGKSFYFSSGLPVKFSGFYRREGEQKTFVEQDYISKKTFVAAGEQFICPVSTNNPPGPQAPLRGL